MELAYSKEVKIRNLDSPDSIIEMLNYLYVLLNVKKENQLNEIEESVLNGVILNNFWNFTISEIKHAFRLAVAGKLNIELYQKLDSITFGKVLVGYNAYKQQKIRNFKSRTMSKETKKLRRNKGERISLDEVMSNKTQKMYASCIALYHKADTLNYEK